MLRYTTAYAQALSQLSCDLILLRLNMKSSVWLHSIKLHFRSVWDVLQFFLRNKHRLPTQWGLLIILRKHTISFKITHKLYFLRNSFVLSISCDTQFLLRRFHLNQHIRFGKYLMLVSAMVKDDNILAHAVNWLMTTLLSLSLFEIDANLNEIQLDWIMNKNIFLK